MTLRTVRQPGPPASPRAAVVRAGIRPIEAVLPAGGLLLDALAALLAEHGVESACLTLSGGGFGPFGYVIPALSPDGSQAAFYSEAFRPEGESRLDIAAVTVGWRDGAVFFHCHALWTEPDGRQGCGHVLPPDTAIASPVSVAGAGLVGARFEVHPDPETGFSLFGPVAGSQPVTPGLRRGVAVRLAPNQELGGALADAAMKAGFGRAVVRGGVASIIGARFADGTTLDGFATELLVRRGLVGSDQVPDLEIVIVDLHGTIRSGRLLPGDNPVLMTFEGVLEEA